MFRIFFSIIIMIIISTCHNTPNQYEKRKPPRQLTQVEQKIVQSSNTFGFELFQEINKTESANNVFISPLSVSMALSMTLNGANGATYDSMRSVLGFVELSEQEINEGYKNLIALLTTLDPKVIFQIGNSIWCRKNFSIEKAFIDTNKFYFNAEIASLDFESPGAVSTINAWVERSTNRKIKGIVTSPIPWNVVMYLINAIYFKGTWAYQFDPKQTKDEPFYIPNGLQVTCKMMNISGKFAYYYNDQYQVVELPYGDGLFCMTIVLPKSDVDINTFIGQFTQEHWINIKQQLVKQEGDLFLPKFTLEFEKQLNDVLKAMGMSIAFDPSYADFTRISKGGELFISDVKHKTFVDVNEEGTEAAAVTSIEIGITSVPERFYMKVDRPFMFIIHDKHSGNLLFMGKIVEPKM